MGGWQPIETAPKDGRIILGWSAGWKSPAAIQWVPELEYTDELGDPRYERAELELRKRHSIALRSLLEWGSKL
jgi:hypothetical protein